MTNPRTRAKIEARIHERTAYCVEFELNDPRAAFITVTGVQINDDLSLAKVFYSVLGTKGEKSKAAHMLDDASGFIRRQLGRVLRTRRIPQLRWIYDDSIEIQAQVEDAIISALERDRSINPEAHDEMGELIREEAPAAGEVADQESGDFLDAPEEEEENDGN